MYSMQISRIRPLDIVILILFALTVLWSAFNIGKQSGKKTHVLAQGNGKTYILPLDKDDTYRIEGLLGDSIITVKDGEARFVDSPCPNKTCTQSGGISHPGQWAACLPNDVFIRVEGSKAELDATAQ